MKRLLLLCILMVTLLTPAALAEGAELIWENDGMIWIMSEEEAAAVPAANAASGTVTLTASKTEALVGETVTITASAPGAEGVRIYRYTGGENVFLLREEAAESVSASYGGSRAGTYQYVAAACYGGVWTTDFDHILSIKYTSKGQLTVPEYTAPSSAVAGELFSVTVGGVANGERYSVIIDRTVDGVHVQAGQQHLQGPGTLDFTVHEAGVYQMTIIASGTGWDSSYAYGEITILESDKPTPTATLLSDPEATYYMGNTVRVRVEMAGATQFVSRQVDLADTDVVYPAVNGQADCDVQITAYSSNRCDIRFYAVMNGENTGFSAAVSVPVTRIPIPTLSFYDTVARGETLTVTVGNMPLNWEYTHVSIYDEENAKVFNGDVTDRNDPTLAIDTRALTAGNYRVRAYQYISDTPTASSSVENPLTVTAAESAYCGENVTWALSDDGTLTISGTGKMFSYYSEATPWGYDIKKVIVEPGVTVVGGNAFMNCYNLKSVQLPAGLKRIGQRAFSYCYNMEEVNLPDSLESIGACAFMGCEQLIEVVIPAGIENIGFGTFQSCVNIKKVSLPTGLTRIGKYAFASCLSLEALVIPDSVTDIDSYALVGGRDLKAIRLPDTISHIGEDIFGGSDVAVFCNSASATSQWAKGQGLTVFPLDKDIIILPEDIKTVESEAFAGLSEPTTVVIPDTVEYIARDAFSGSTVAIRANDGTEGANYAHQLELPRFPD